MGRRTVAVLFVASTALLCLGRSSNAQQRPGPLLQLDEKDGAVLTVTPPAEWALYAPDLPGSEKPGAGLALEVTSYPGGRAVRVYGPEPREEITAAGRVLVYRERVRLRLSPLPDNVRELEVRWAICRETLCIPGRTRLVRGPRQSRR